MGSIDCTHELSRNLATSASMEDLYRPRESDLAGVSETLGEAFYDYPVYKFVLQNDEARKQRHPKVFRIIANYGHRSRKIYATTKSCEGVMLCSHSDEPQATGVQLVRCGLLKALFTSWGLKYLLDLGRITKINQEVLIKNAPFPHIYLEVLGVHPSQQGKGYGSMLLNALLSKVDAEGLPCYLETFLSRNAAIYGRFGFKLLEERTIPSTPLTLYSMLREPQE